MQIFGSIGGFKLFLNEMGFISAKQIEQQKLGINAFLEEKPTNYSTTISMSQSLDPA